MIEVWEDIKGYTGLYKVSNLGRVKSLERVVNRRNSTPQTVRERILKPATNTDGYLIVSLRREKKAKTFAVHRLVAKSFMKDVNETVNHIDGNKTNNHLGNLEWCTRKDNCQHAYDNKLKKKMNGCDNGRSKFSVEDILNIRKLYGQYDTVELGVMYNVNNTTIGRIVNNITYKEDIYYGK